MDSPRTPTDFLRYILRPVETSEVDDVYQLLSNRRRRLVIVRVFVLGSDETVAASTLARQIAAVETESEPETVAGDDYDTVRNGLIQTHLPALADAQIITYDDRAKCVARGPNLHAGGVAMLVTIVILRVLLVRSDESSG